MISVIIPTFNEEKNIKTIIAQFKSETNLEIIVVDGGSTDNTLAAIKNFDLKIIKTKKNRASQLNAGANIAKGDIFFFLHADCLIEAGSLNAIEQCISAGFIGGCLRQKINSSKRIYRFIEKSGNIRAKISKIFYGDQTIFIKKKIFLKINGFDNVPLFDDIMFTKKMRNAGKTCMLPSKVFVSARRWEKQGIVKTTFINWIVSIGFLLGISTNYLKKIYKEIR